MLYLLYLTIIPCILQYSFSSYFVRTPRISQLLRSFVLFVPFSFLPGVIVCNGCLTRTMIEFTYCLHGPRLFSSFPDVCIFPSRRIYATRTLLLRINSFPHSSCLERFVGRISHDYAVKTDC